MPSNNSDGKQDAKPGFMGKLSYITIAASVILLIGITYFIARSFGMPHLAKKYYAAPLAQIQRSDASPEDSLYQNGMKAFTNKEWSDAINYFSLIEKSYPHYARSFYYLAHAYIGKKKYDKALAIFEDPIFKQGQFEQQAEWNKILIKMFLDYPKDEIISDLNQIANNQDHLYRDKAKELLERINPKK